MSDTSFVIETESDENPVQWFVEWNATKAGYERKSTIVDLFERQVSKRPDAIAVVCGTDIISYSELDRRANRLAHYLIAQGIGKKHLVGIALNRCIDLIVSVIGTLKAGAAYVAIDPTYPRERLSSMLADVSLSALLTHEAIAQLLPEHAARVICLDALRQLIDRENSIQPNRTTDMDDLVYVIFTSGSTGRAKAAAVHHRGWTNLIQWFVRTYDIVSADKVLIVSSFGFDITQRAIAMPLIVGGQLHLLNSNAFDPAAIRNAVLQSKISIMNVAPSAFYPVVEFFGGEEVSSLPSLRIVFLGGEAISASRLRAFAAASATKLVNVYGAAECSDVSAAYTLGDFERYTKSSVPIGSPINNTQIYLMDENLALLPQGEIGEICIAGDGVGKGYINDQELTTRKFVNDPGGSGILYRTGDLGRIASDGVLEFVGRVDHQIKLRGWRIDIGDVEAGLRQDDRIREAVVVKRNFGGDDDRLVAFVVPEAGVPTTQEVASDLKRSARHRLPEQMVPSVFVFLESMPLSPNGKIERSILLNMDIPKIEPDHLVNPPETPIEEGIAKIFARVLKVDAVNRTDNFFDLGGYSSLLTEMLAYINDEHAAEMTVYEFLLAPTVCDVASRVERGPIDR